MILFHIFNVNYASDFIHALTDPWISFIAKFAIVAFFIIINLMGLREVGMISTILSILLLGVTTIIMMNFDFTTLLAMLMPLALMVYVILGLALIIIRKRYPVEERTVWYIKGGKVKLWLTAIAPMVIAVIGLLVNGTEYFLLGFVSIGSAIVAYIAFKLIYGGLYKIDPDKYPINIHTKLAKGDMQRIGAFILAFGVYAVVGSLFLSWYEGSWGPEYYLDMYGSGLQSDFWLMISIARIGGIIGAVAGAVLLFIGKKRIRSDRRS